MNTCKRLFAKEFKIDWKISHLKQIFKPAIRYTWINEHYKSRYLNKTQTHRSLLSSSLFLVNNPIFHPIKPPHLHSKTTEDTLYVCVLYIAQFRTCATLFINIRQFLRKYARPLCFPREDIGWKIQNDRFKVVTARVRALGGIPWRVTLVEQFKKPFHSGRGASVLKISRF